jgi:hypothetical protein
LSVTAYAIDDAISDSGSSYIATASSTNHEPPNSSYWNLLAQAGATGSTGSTGATGSTGSTGPSSLSAYVPLTDGAPITWATGGIPVTNAYVTLAHTTSTRALNLSDLVDGEYGTLWVIQDSTGGSNITGGTGCTWYVANSAGGFTATSTFFASAPGASSHNIITWSYVGATTSCIVNTH